MIAPRKGIFISSIFSANSPTTSRDGSSTSSNSETSMINFTMPSFIVLRILVSIFSLISSITNADNSLGTLKYRKSSTKLKYLAEESKFITLYMTATVLSGLKGFVIQSANPALIAFLRASSSP